MIGKVDSSGRTLISVPLRKSPHEEQVFVEVWVDTGFTGDLVLPHSVIESLELKKSGTVDAVLADGSQIELNTYSCLIDWFGTTQPLEIIANEGEYSLLGVGLLLGLELRIDFLNLYVQLHQADSEDF